MDRYYQYKMRDTIIQEDAIIMMQNGIRVGQVASILQDKYKIPIRSMEIHRVVQTRRDNLKSLSEMGIQTSEIHRLLNEINKYNDQYRIKFKEDTQIMECILYWNPRDVELAHHFCQICMGYDHMDANSRYFKLIRHSRIIHGDILCWRSQL